ncbi:MAG: ABC transporter ATP-binding protein/permease [Planctomycetota bacterium]|nr:ABC transporter ATP-binding protein/permease [Planctomycetota bacterium]
MKSSTPAGRSTYERMLGQPLRLPEDLRAQIEAEMREPVVYYALADLDASLKLARTWVALGAKTLALAPERGAVLALPRDRIRTVRKTPGLSAATLALLGAPGEPALALLRYSQRQARAMENLQFLLEQGLKGQAAPPVDADRAYEDSVTQGVREAQASVAANRLSVVWHLLSYLRPYKRRLALGMAGAIFLALLNLIPPYLTGRLIDGVLKPSEAGALPREQALRLGWILVAGVAAVFVLRELLLWVRLRMLATLGELVARDIRRELYEHLQTLSMKYFSTKRTGSLISRVTSDTDRLWEFLAFGIVEVLLAGITLLGLGAVLIALDWRLGLLMALPVPLLFGAIWWHGQSMQEAFLRCWRKWSALTDVLSDTIPGIKVVKAFNREEGEKARFGGRNVDFTDECNGVHASWTAFWPALMLGIHALLIGLWVFGMPRILHAGEAGVAPLSVGTFIAFLLYAGMFMHPIEVVGQVARMLNRATSSAHRIFEVLDARPEFDERAGGRRLDPVRGRVTFEDVRFTYDGLRPVLKGVSFDVRPGEMIGLVGPSGAGKTTVTNLIVRFCEPSGGRVLIDGVPLRELDAGHFRRQVGMVLQDPHLFHGTVLENIRYGCPEATLERVLEAARAANAHDFICKLPYGYETTVGERGHTLSGGERQRISIARALMTDPRVLILDEATSSVDTETERKIQEALDRLVKGRTVFAIAHRLSTLKRASRLFVVEDGQIAEQGTHEELLQKEDGVYRKLHRLQQELHEMYAV